jgi:nucleolar protein 14
MRKDTRFEARQQIKEKKESHDRYHSRMSKILNTITTVEGAEKNEYETEEKHLKGKK